MSDEHAPAPGHDPAGEHDGGHAGPVAAGAHGAPDPHADDHAAHGGHEAMSLGPVDWTAWAIGVVGVLAGVVVAVCAALSTGAISV